MGGKTSSLLRDDEIERISGETKFTASQIERLHSRFTHLDRSNRGSLSKSDLMAIPELSINPIGDRIVQMFFLELNEDNDRISFAQFAKILAHFQPTDEPARDNPVARSLQDRVSDNRSPGISRDPKLSTRNVNNTYKDDVELPTKIGDQELRQTSFARFRSKLDFLYRLHDYDKDGKIGFSDLRRLIKSLVGSCVDECKLDKMALRAFVEVDENNDGFIDFEEFCKVFSGKDIDEKFRVKFFS